MPSNDTPDRLAEKQKRADDARRAFRNIGKPKGFTEPRPVLYPDAYTEAEHRAALDRLLNDLK